MSEEVVSEEETKPQGHQDDAAGQNPAEQQQVEVKDSEMNAPFNKDDDETIPEYTALFTLQGHKRSVSSLCISPDGQQLASSGADGLLKVWSMATGTLIVTLDAALAKVMDVVVEEDEEQDRSHLKLGICDVAWSKDGRYLVSGGDDCMVRVWDVGKVSLLFLFFLYVCSFLFCMLIDQMTFSNLLADFGPPICWSHFLRLLCQFSSRRIVSCIWKFRRNSPIMESTTKYLSSNHTCSFRSSYSS